MVWLCRERLCQGWLEMVAIFPVLVTFNYQYSVTLNLLLAVQKVVVSNLAEAFHITETTVNWEWSKTRPPGSFYIYKLDSSSSILRGPSNHVEITPFADVTAQTASSSNVILRT